MRNWILILFTAGMLGLTFVAQAQSYRSAMGIRLGTEWGLSFKYQVFDKVTAEAIFQSSFSDPANRLSILGAKHFPLITKGFNLYFGGGPHLGWLDLGIQNQPVHAGITFIGGAEITLGKLNVSWDIKPAINVIGISGYKFVDPNTAVSVRYVFNKYTSQTKKGSSNKQNRSSTSTKRRSGKI
jgi:hypothetical protein